MMQSLYGVWLGDVFLFFRRNIGTARRCMESRGTKAAIWRRRSSVSVCRVASCGTALAESASKCGRSQNVKRRQLLGRTLEGLAVSPKDAFRLLLQWDDKLFHAAGIQAGEEMRYWVKAAQFTQELLLRGAIAPAAAFAAKTGARRRTGQETLRGVAAAFAA